MHSVREESAPLSTNATSMHAVLQEKLANYTYVRVVTKFLFLRITLDHFNRLQTGVQGSGS